MHKTRSDCGGHASRSSWRFVNSPPSPHGPRQLCAHSCEHDCLNVRDHLSTSHARTSARTSTLARDVRARRCSTVINECAARMPWRSTERARAGGAAASSQNATNDGTYRQEHERVLRMSEAAPRALPGGVRALPKHRELDEAHPVVPLALSLQDGLGGP